MNASQHQEHLTALERLRAEHEAELEQLAEQMIQLEGGLDDATASGEAHAAAVSVLQQRLEQQEDQAKAAAAQARVVACRCQLQEQHHCWMTANVDRTAGGVRSQRSTLIAMHRQRRSSRRSGRQQIPRRRSCTGSWTRCSGMQMRPLPPLLKRRSSCGWMPGRRRPTTGCRCSRCTHHYFHQLTAALM